MAEGPGVVAHGVTDKDVYADVLSMPETVAEAEEWQTWSNLLAHLARTGHDVTATWLSYVVCALGAEVALDEIRDSIAEQETGMQLSMRLGSKLPADVEVVVMRIEQMHRRIAARMQVPEQAVEEAREVALWLYTMNPALGADEREANPKGQPDE
jgi:hypothetical protein